MRHVHAVDRTGNARTAVARATAIRIAATRLAATRIAVALALIATLSGAAVGCTAEEKVLASDFFTSYFESRLLGQEGGWLKAARLATTGKSGDPTTDAALEAKKAIESINKADGLAEKADEARDKGDFTKADEHLRSAIDTRPHDYTYRVKLHVLAIEAGWEDPGDVAGAPTIQLGDMKPAAQVVALSYGIDEAEAGRARIRAWSVDRRGPDDSDMYAADRRFAAMLARFYETRSALYAQMGLSDRAAQDADSAEFYREYSP